MKRQDSSLRHHLEELVDGGVFRVGARRQRTERSCQQREVQQDIVQGTGLLEVALLEAVVAARRSSSEVGSGRLRERVRGGVGLTATCSRGSSFGAEGILSRTDHGGAARKSLRITGSRCFEIAIEICLRHHLGGYFRQLGLGQQLGRLARERDRQTLAPESEGQQGAQLTAAGKFCDRNLAKTPQAFRHKMILQQTGNFVTGM